ncbi:MAG TPA: helix-turn-helix domain-containing protein [Acidimicrobiia bacterium]
MIEQERGEAVMEQRGGQGRSTEADVLAAVSALGEPTRRAVYEHVAAVGDWVSRDEAADAVALERATAAHHLDRLAADGLLEVEYQRRSGRSGPGAGRPAKVYRRARRDFGVALPPRDYGLIGRLLADAVDRARTSGVDLDVALDEVARREGECLADELRSQEAARRKGARANVRELLVETLRTRGFEPRTEPDGTVVLGNCPFHQLAREHTDLVCGVNHCLLQTAIDEIGGTGYEARLEPEPGMCCVRLHLQR